MPSVYNKTFKLRQSNFVIVIILSKLHLHRVKLDAVY